MASLWEEPIWCNNVDRCFGGINVEDFGKTEIGDNETTGGVDEDVGGFDVPVNDAFGMKDFEAKDLEDSVSALASVMRIAMTRTYKISGVESNQSRGQGTVFLENRFEVTRGVICLLRRN